MSLPRDERRRELETILQSLGGAEELAAILQHTHGHVLPNGFTSRIVDLILEQEFGAEPPTEAYGD